MRRWSWSNPRNLFWVIDQFSLILLTFINAKRTLLLLLNNGTATTALHFLSIVHSTTIDSSFSKSATNLASPLAWLPLFWWVGLPTHYAVQRWKSESQCVLLDLKKVKEKHWSRLKFNVLDRLKVNFIEVCRMEVSYWWTQHIRPSHFTCGTYVSPSIH